MSQDQFFTIFPGRCSRCNGPIFHDESGCVTCHAVRKTPIVETEVRTGPQLLTETTPTTNR